MQSELWAYSPELDRSFIINNDLGIITPVTLTPQEREQIFKLAQAQEQAKREHYEAEQWEIIRREYYDECYRDEPDRYAHDEPEG